MQSLHTNIRIISICFTALLVTTGLTRAHAQGNTQPIHVVLPDPTPRERDLHTIYADDPVQRLRQQHAADVQKLQRRQQILADTDQLLLLAQQLRNSVVNHDTSVPISDVMTAQKIEKLAKGVKDQMQ